MAFDKSYPNRKDQRKPYRKSGKHDKTCRPGGTCPYCQRNRAHANRVRDLSAREQVGEAAAKPPQTGG